MFDFIFHCETKGNVKQKDVRISVRISNALKLRLAEAEEKTGIPEADLVRCCAEALVDYVEKNGEITMPLIVKPKSAEATKKFKYPPPHPGDSFEEALMEEPKSPSPKPKTKAA